MRILLVDLSSVLFPIWHVSGSDPDPDHVSTETVAAVRRIASRFDRAVVCCDSRKSWRKVLDPTYKAQRDTKPEALFFQLGRAKDILRSDGLAVLEADTFEADDVIATCVDLLSGVEDCEEILVASADKDLAQLVRDADEDGRVPPVRILSLRTNEIRSAADVQKLFGVQPSQIGDFLALVGDASDNVKGAPGIGEKKATALLTRFGDLAGIYGALERAGACDAWEELFRGTPHARLIGGQAVFTALRESGKVVSLARKLVDLRHDVPIALDAILNPPKPTPQADATPLPSIEDASPDEPEETVFYAQEDPSMTMSAQTITTEQVVDQVTGEVTQVQVQLQEQPAPAVTSTAPQATTKQQTPPQPQAATAGKELSRLLAAPATFERALEPSTADGAVRIAGHLFNSKMFGKHANPDSILGAILLGRELGLGAMGSLRGIANIEGKYGLSADLMEALVLKSGKAEYFEPVELTDKRAIYRTKRVGRPERVMEFKLEEAERAKILKKDSGWEKWPLDMCKARCIARLARTIYPDVVFGLYTTEELRDEVL